MKVLDRTCRGVSLILDTAEKIEKEAGGNTGAEIWLQASLLPAKQASSFGIKPEESPASFEINVQGGSASELAGQGIRQFWLPRR
jgi:hypothetical protein